MCSLRKGTGIISAKRLTHLVVTILALSPRANERIKPRLDAVTDDSM